MGSPALGWTGRPGIVFGLALSVASTVVLLRALQERHVVETERGRIAVGWLIVEDHRHGPGARPAAGRWAELGGESQLRRMRPGGFNGARRRSASSSCSRW
jgi:hypothetical protein